MASTTRESSLWQWLKRGADSFGQCCHIQRIENSAGVGTPDVEGCLEGNSFQVELKVGTLTKQGVLRFHLRPEQRMWHSLRWKAGGDSWVLVQAGSNRYLFQCGQVFNDQLTPMHSWIPIDMDARGVLIRMAGGM